MTNPRLLVVVLGTSTGVGKTWVTAALARRLCAQGLVVAARKPVESYDPADVPPTDPASANSNSASSDPANFAPTDSAVLAEATGTSADKVCPPHRRYPLAMAPPMAAQVLGLPPFTVGDLVAETTWPQNTDVGLVETVGGPRSPVAKGADSLALAAAFRPDMALLVADAGLGAINSVHLAADAITSELGAAPVVLLNRFNPADRLHRLNHTWLANDDIDLSPDINSLATELACRVTRARRPGNDRTPGSQRLSGTS
ncbi:MAG: ATP-dependent dethiobiotin synthetase BioD [Acidimicrobiales bacterium]